jgi:hypothetical protein
VSLMVTTLDPPVTIRPRGHINTESMCSWFEIKDDLPQLPTISSPEQLKELFSR